MKEQVKKRFLVRNVEEASIVDDALTRIALLIMDISYKKPEKEKERWETFTRIVKDADWSYMERMAAEYRKDSKNSLILTNICPDCDSRLTREHIEGKTIASCPSCGKAWEILKK